MENRQPSCPEVREYIDGLTQRGFQAAMESGPKYEHLRQCGACRAYLQRAKSLSKKLNRWRVPVAKRNITAGVMAQIAQLERQRQTKPFSLRRRLPALLVYRLKVPAGLAAAVFIILAISLALNITGIDTRRDAKEAHQARTEQTVQPGINFTRNIPPSPPVGTGPKVVQLQSGSKEKIQFFRINPEIAPTSLVVILGAPGVIALETTPEPVKANFSNQSL